MNNLNEPMEIANDFNNDFIWYLTTSEYDFNEVLVRGQLTVKDYKEILEKDGQVDKKILFKWIFGIGLNKKEAENLLYCAGYYPINCTFDNVVFSFIEKENYDKYQTRGDNDEI